MKKIHYYSLVLVPILLSLSTSSSNKTEDAIVKIVGPRGSFGSGVIISEDGYVASAGHVAALFPTDHDRVQFYLSNGKSYQGHVVARDPDHDDAILQMDGVKDMYHLDLGALPKVGDKVVAWGWSGGRLAPKSLQYLSTMTSPRGDDMWLSGGITFGDSGGPILDKDGKVVGLIVAKCDQDHSSIGVSVEKIKKIYAGTQKWMEVIWK